MGQGCCKADNVSNNPKEAYKVPENERGGDGKDVRPGRPSEAFESKPPAQGEASMLPAVSKEAPPEVGTVPPPLPPPPPPPLPPVEAAPLPLSISETERQKEATPSTSASASLPTASPSQSKTGSVPPSDTSQSLTLSPVSKRSRTTSACSPMPTPPSLPPPPPMKLNMTNTTNATNASCVTPPADDRINVKLAEENQAAFARSLTPPTLTPPLRSTKFSKQVNDVTDESGRRRVNDYDVLKHLGSGRYGEVFLVENKEKEMYAMKEVSKKVFTNQKSDLSKEVLVLTKIDHPNVVKLIEVLDDESLTQQFLILEYVDGGPIMTLDCTGKSKEEPFTEQVTRAYFQQIVEGLCYLHDLNIIHRDIKPENILITADRQVVKLADFGVSRAMKSEDDGSRDTGGTPLFLSPETCRGDFSSGKSNDIWALGVTLYIFMFGMAPFLAPNEIILYQRIQTGKIAYPSTPKYSRELLSFIKRLLERNVLMRITLNEVRNHSWNRGSTAPVPDVDKSFQSITDEANDEEKRKRALTPFEMTDSRTKPGAENTVNILIVEDVFLVRKLTERMFRSILDPEATINIVMATDGADAITACKTDRFHLVLMDVHMSRVSGVSATCQIAEYETSKSLAPTNIVGLTADPHEDLDRVCLQAGMHQVIQKPLQPTVLREICQQFGLPLNSAETKFDVSDFKKGEVRGGGQNNAYLKSFQEHIEGGKDDKVSTPQKSFSSQPSSHHSNEEKSQSQLLSPVDPKLGDMLLTREGSVASEMSSSMCSLSSADTSDMRNRSLHCMKQHKNMYGKKNCDDKFMFISPDDMQDALCSVMQGLISSCGDWSILNRITPEDCLELYELWSDESEGWQFELEAIHSVVPYAELNEKFIASEVWDNILTARAEPEPPVEDDSKPKLSITVFSHEEMGSRRGMEDTCSVVFNPSALLKGEKSGETEVAVGVFDGHGGKYAAEYCKQYLIGKLVRSSLYNSDLGAAMRQCYYDVNKGFFKKVEGVDCDAGTTAVLAVIKNRTLTVANTGDCRLVIGSTNSKGEVSAKQITNLHVCESKEERERVEKRGGSVIHYMGSWRVNGVLLVTRSIGDMPCRDFVTCEPDIHTHQIKKRDKFAILASDGLWDVMTPTEVCEAVYSAKEELDAAAEGEGGDSEGGGEQSSNEKKSDASGEEDEEEEEMDLSYAAIPEVCEGRPFFRCKPRNGCRTASPVHPVMSKLYFK